MTGFRAESLTVSYGASRIIDGCSFALENGCVTGLLGANGSGKTTLLRAICGILPHGGSCTLDGTALEEVSVRQLAKLCAYIPQRSGISIDIPVIDVVLMGFHARLGLLGHPTAAMRRAASAALTSVGLGGMEEHNYLHLSEGQKQLCIFARTLVTDCRMLILDEPESALDYRLRYRMLTLLRERIGQRRGCALVALHDPVLALNCCDRLLFLSGGRIAGAVSPMTDPPEETERQLSSVYGPVQLSRCVSRTGTAQWVMLRDVPTDDETDREGGRP